jgi:outer membrane protein, heavy metal efflux system
MTGWYELASEHRRKKFELRFCLFAAICGTLTIAPPTWAQASALPAVQGEDRSLASITLDEVLRAALAHSPELSEAQARTRAAREQAPALSRLPDPELEYQLWAQPLARPLALDEAQMHMVGVRQAFPAPGTLGARADAAAARAEVGTQSYRARRLELSSRVRRAYGAYYLADREYALHVEHARLAAQVMALARAGYEGGRGTQQDVLRASLELTRLHSTLVTVEADRRSARALLNTLMGRDVDAPLGPPAELPSSALTPSASFARSSAEHRPELAAARHAIKAEESELSASRAAGTWPSFMVGVEYMYMPMMEDQHNYGVMLSMSLPWFNARYGEETRAAEARVSAERNGLLAARRAADYELFAARQRFEAARKSLVSIEADLLPQAQRNFEAAQANYRGGQLDSMTLLDALRQLLDLRTERVRAIVRVLSATAEAERAAGIEAQAASGGGTP